MNSPVHDFAAPPARQAHDRLAGIQGADLPLTAFFRRHSGTIAVACVALALAALAGFVVPFLLGR